MGINEKGIKIPKIFNFKVLRSIYANLRLWLELDHSTFGLIDPDSTIFSQELDDVLKEISKEKYEIDSVLQTKKGKSDIDYLIFKDFNSKIELHLTGYNISDLVRIKNNSKLKVGNNNNFTKFGFRHFRVEIYKKSKRIHETKIEESYKFDYYTVYMFRKGLKNKIKKYNKKIDYQFKNQTTESSSNIKTESISDFKKAIN